MFQPTSSTSMKNVGKVRLYKRLAIEVKARQHEIDTHFDVRLRGEVAEDNPLAAKSLSIVDVSENPSTTFDILIDDVLFSRTDALAWYNEHHQSQIDAAATMADLRRKLKNVPGVRLR